MADATLNAIRSKVRRLTRTPSEDLLTTAELDQYINTFYAYDFPNHIKPTVTLKKSERITLTPYIDFVDFPSINNELKLSSPVYIGGTEVYFTQDKEDFFRLYPQNKVRKQIATGNGVTTAFTATTLDDAPLLISDHSTVFFTAISTNANGPQGLNVFDDVPNRVSLTNTPLTGDVALGGTINYVTGAYNLSFSSAPDANAPIYAHYQLGTLSIPDTVLYFENKLYLRPVPDQPYQIEFTHIIKPTDLTDVANTPILEQWWQYIAYGAAKKVFEDRMDMESVQLLMPEFKKQEKLCMRRTLEQLATQRAQTIYTQSRAFGYGWPYINN